MRSVISSPALRRDLLDRVHDLARVARAEELLVERQLERHGV